MEAGIFDQGLWSYSNFSDYKNKWIIPNMLKDLETIFEGAYTRWLKNNELYGKETEGRGDFVLATALFALFDHLGMFLAESKYKQSLQPYENIIRVAELLESTNEISHVLANFGRNALVHGAWPQTARSIEGETDWVFGLNIFAKEEEDSHMTLYVKKYADLREPENDSKKLYNVLKLRLNIRVLRRELDYLVKNNEAFEGEKTIIFKEIKDLAIDSIKDDSPSFFKKTDPKGNRFGKEKKAEFLNKQINNLFDRAKNLLPEAEEKAGITLEKLEPGKSLILRVGQK